MLSQWWVGSDDSVELMPRSNHVPATPRVGSEGEWGGGAISTNSDCVAAPGTRDGAGSDMVGVGGILSRGSAPTTPAPKRALFAGSDAPPPSGQSCVLS